MISKFIDYKVTCWKRIEFSEDEDMSKIIEEIKNKGNLDECSKIWNKYIGLDDLLETESFMSSKNNDGFATIEVFENDEIIWANGKH